MRRQAQHCPVARAVDLLADPWTLLIVRELVLGSRQAHEIARGVPGLSSAMLSGRLRTLVNAGLVDRSPGTPLGSQYQLTIAGRELRALVDHLGRWGNRWLPPPRPEDLDPDLLLFDMARQADRDRLPVRPVSVLIDFLDGPPPRRWWLVLSRAGTAASARYPGVRVAVRLECTLTALAEVWLGYVPWLTAVGSASVRISGIADATAAVIGWVGVCRYAAVPRSGTGSVVCVAEG
ncbi:helix-turn-helix domain-containing protein [Actinophytocola sp.]|uniref:winged helix-turn-helix transcriptional regulator n=1 Tax=Actinophytocola sp. TaxID=1872138 RepID=UPI002D7F7C46|nr:helix-turn-helix domain-containing protein [Actinophytocola sp.]HET9142703.1 helix-turn-helix domain-containing protein [Actinophytocola sp.]